MKIKLHKIRKKDYYFVFKLRNDKSVRRISIEQKVIKYPTHLEWIKKFIVKKNIFLIIKKKNIRIGYIRIEKKFKYFFVSIALLNKYRGKGLALKALLHAERFAFVNFLYAIVLKNNLRSIALFKSADYNILKYNKKYLFMKKKIKKSFKNKLKKVRKL